MGNDIIHSARGPVEVRWRPDLEAVCLKWFDDCDERTRVRDAVLAALASVNAEGVAHWVADVSTSPRSQPDADYRWVSGEELRSAVRSSTRRKFVLIPPLPTSGRDTGWVADREANTLAGFRGRIDARVCKDIAETRRFLRP